MKWDFFFPRKKTKQLLKLFQGWKLKKFKPFEGCATSQFAYKSVVFSYKFSRVIMSYGLTFWRAIF